MSILSAFQLIATTVLAIYIIGALYHLIAIVTFTIRRRRNLEVPVLVDVLSRLFVIFDVTIFWPINLTRKS